MDNSLDGPLKAGVRTFVRMVNRFGPGKGLEIPIGQTLDLLF